MSKNKKVVKINSLNTWKSNWKNKVLTGFKHSRCKLLSREQVVL